MKVKTAQAAHGFRLTACQRSYQEGCRAREAHLLPSGLYKLQELSRRMRQADETIHAIARQFLRGGVTRLALSPGLCCTPADQAAWLKSLPEAVASQLGYDLVPAVAALTGDGVSPSTASRCGAVARHRAGFLVAECDEVRSLLQLSINAEYNAMRAGSSIVLPLVKGTLSLVDDVCALAGL